MTKKKTLTTFNGAPVDDNQNSLSAGERGPLMLQDHHLLEKLAHFNRERIPERIVHAKGAGAFGTLKITNDISIYTKAKSLQLGSESKVFLRFSTVAGEKGSADTVRDVRGFALKVYTEDGNWDLVGNNSPVFFVRDPKKFMDFIHSQKREPHTNLRSDTMQWDFWANSPETLHQVTILFSDRGIPKSYATMNGYGSHTYSFINDKNERYWVKFHFKTESGIENFTSEEADKIAGSNPDYTTKELYDRIENGNFPSWKFYVQIMSEKDAETYKWNPFDLTKVWPHEDYELIEVGTLELNQNSNNYFADVEQSAFAPSNIVPGISFSPDKMLQGRLFAYPDAHRYRLGVNHHHIPVNSPINKVNSYNRDGYMRTDGNFGSNVNYEPNSFGGPIEDKTVAEPPMKINAMMDRFTQEITDDDFIQPGNLYRILPEDEKIRLINNIVNSLKKVPKSIQEKMIVHFTRADPDYGKRIVDALK